MRDFYQPFARGLRELGYLQSMGTTRIPGHETSVTFNLRELMRLEHERVSAEQNASRAAEEQVACARRESERRAAEDAARERAAVLAHERATERERSREAERAENERAAALLRAQLDAEAAERVERQRLEFEHARNFDRLRLERRSRRVAALALGAFIALLAGGGVAFFAVLQPRLQLARASAAEAAMLAANYARDLAGLHDRLTALAARPAACVASPRTPEPTIASAATQTDRAKRHGSGRPARQQVSSESGVTPELDSIDGENNDPLWGLDARPAAKRDHRAGTQR